MDSLDSINYKWIETYLNSRENNSKDKIKIDYLCEVLKETAALSQSLQKKTFIPSQTDLAVIEKISSIVERTLEVEELNALVTTKLLPEEIILIKELYHSNSLVQEFDLIFYSNESRTKYNWLIDTLTKEVEPAMLKGCCRALKNDIRNVTIYYELVKARSKVSISDRIGEINDIQRKLGAEEFFSFFDKHIENSVDALFVLRGLEKEEMNQVVRVDLAEDWNGLTNLTELVRFAKTPLFKEFMLDDAFRDSFLRTMNTLPTGIKSSMRSHLREAVLESELPIDTIKKIFAFSSGNPLSSLIFLENYSEVKEIIDTFPQMSPSFAYGLSDLIPAKPSLAHAKTLVDIAKKVSPDAAEKCLEIWKVGEDALFNEILLNFETRESPFDRFIHPEALSKNPQDPHLLAALVKIKNEKLISAVLKDGLDDINISLVKLESQGETRFVEKIISTLQAGKISEKEVSILRLLQSGEIDLALSFMNQWDKKLGLWVGQIPEIYRSAPLLRQIYMIQRDLKALGISDFPLKIPEIATQNEIESTLRDIQLWIIECNENPEKKSQFSNFKNIKSHLENRFENILKQEKNAVEGLIKCLMTPTGEIPPSLIAILRETNAYQSFLDSCPKLQKAEITLFLDMLSNNSSIPIRLEAIQYNEKISRLLQIKNPSKVDINKALYTSLMTPTRQHDLIGSCFATSLAIVQDQSQLGLMQTFEDYLSLINDQKLVRLQKTDYGPIKKMYPAIAFDRNKIGSDEVPYLSRVREMTMASMGGATAKEKLLLQSANLISKWAEEDNPAISRKIIGWLDAYTQVIFAPLGEKDSNDKWVDIWRLQESADPLSDPKAMMELYMRCIDGIQEDSFKKSLLEKIRAEEALREISESKPWRLISEGSSQQSLIHEYTLEDKDLLENRHIVFGGKDILKMIVDNQHRLPADFRKQLIENPHLRVNVSSQDHAFTYLPRGLEDIMSKGENWYKTFAKDYSIDRNTVLKQGVIMELFSSMKNDKTYREFLNSPLMKELIFSKKEMTLGALWSDFKDAADVWGFDPVEKKSLLNQILPLLLKVSKNVKPLVLFDENYHNLDIIACQDLSGKVRFLQRYEYEPGKFIYLKCALAEEPMINLPQFPYMPHEFNIK